MCAKLTELHGADQTELIMTEHNLDRSPVNQEFDSVILVENIPQINANSGKMEKLETILRNIFRKFGEIVNIYFAKEDDGKFFVISGEMHVSIRGETFVPINCNYCPLIYLDALANANTHKVKYLLK